MKAFLLAAGYGTRLQPLTEHVPKCLVPICGVPLLAIWLDWCRSSGIDEVLVNAHAHAATVKDFVSRCNSNVRVRIFEESQLLGTAGTLAANRLWVASERCFWVLYGDVLTDADYRPVLDFHLSRSTPITIGVYRVPDPSRCGVVEVGGDDLVLRFVEKAREPAGNLVFAGIMLANPSIFDAFPERRPADLAYDVLPRFVGRMSACEVSGYTMDIGTLANYEEAQTTWPGPR